MELEFIKKALKVDFDDDDDYIALLLEAAAEYIREATGKCDYTSARVRLLSLVIITELYEKRALTVEKAGEKAQYAIRSIITQLQMEEYLDDETGN